MSLTWRARRESILSIASALWLWWRAEVGALSWTLLERIAPRRARRVVLRLGPKGAQVLLAGAEREEDCGTLLPADGTWPESLGEEWTAILRRAARIDVELDDASVLAHVVSFPPAMAAHLAQAVALQIERDAPLPLAQLCTAWRPVPAAPVSSLRPKVTLVMARREFVDTWRQRVQRWHGAGAAVLWRHPTTGQCFRLGETVPPRRAAERSIIDRRLVATAVALAFLWLGTVLAQRMYERVEVRQERARVEESVVKAKANYARYRTDSAPLAALRARPARTATLQALLALTTATPDDAWVYELELATAPDQDAQATLKGFAPAPSVLVDTLESAPQFERVSLQSTAPGSVANGTARFEIRLRLSRAAAPGSTP